MQLLQKRDKEKEHNHEVFNVYALMSVRRQVGLKLPWKHVVCPHGYVKPTIPRDQF